jgi:hypothetical protein
VEKFNQTQVNAKIFGLYFNYISLTIMHYAKQKIAKDMWKESSSKKTQFQTHPRNAPRWVP